MSSGEFKSFGDLLLLTSNISPNQDEDWQHHEATDGLYQRRSSHSDEYHVRTSEARYTHTERTLLG